MVWERFYVVMDTVLWDVSIFPFVFFTSPFAFLHNFLNKMFAYALADVLHILSCFFAFTILWFLLLFFLFLTIFMFFILSPVFFPFSVSSFVSLDYCNFNENYLIQFEFKYFYLYCAYSHDVIKFTKWKKRF